MASLLSESETQIHIAAARALRLDIESLPALNCFHPDAAGVAGIESMQQWIQANHPVEAAQYVAQYQNRVVSLATAGFEHGVVDKTEKVHQEMLETDATYVQQDKADQEARLKAAEEALWAGAQAMAAKNGNPDPREAYEKGQQHNVALAGKMRGYFQGLNEDAAAAHQSQTPQVRI